MLAAPTAHVDRTFRGTGLVKLFEIFETEAEALREVTPTPPGRPAEEPEPSSETEQTALT